MNISTKIWDKRNCIFCNTEKNRIIIESETALAIYDGFPVSKGHMLIISKRHISDYFESESSDREGLWQLVDDSKKYLDKQFKPGGYNVGINCCHAAGQTVMHFNIYLIPRYNGDI